MELGSPLVEVPLVGPNLAEVVVQRRCTDDVADALVCVAAALVAQVVNGAGRRTREAT